MDSFKNAQQDMRAAYYSGGPGVLVSATAWFLAGLVSLLVGSKAGIITLVLAGMLIFPLSVALCKLIGVSGKHDKANPLASLALEGTFWMLICIPIAGAIALYKAEWFFPAMLFVIGGRYLTFSTLYGLRLYWAFAAVLIFSGWILVNTQASVSSGAFTGAVIELCFAIALFVLHRRRPAEYENVAN